MYTYTIDDLIEVKNRSHDEGQKLRLRAIINIRKGKQIQQVAEDLLVSRRSLATWQQRLHKKGTDGLLSNKGGRPEGNPKWSAHIWEELGKEIKTTGGYWSIPKMQDWILNIYQEKIPEQTVWYHLDKLGFSYKSARPHPYKGDKERQESFKKGVLKKRWI